MPSAPMWTALLPADPHRPPRRPVWEHLDDREILAAGLRGDQEAWREFVRRYSRLVFSIPHRYGLDRQASEDVFQEVFIIFLRQLPNIRRRTGLPKWFMTTTHRVCRHRYLRFAVSAGPLAEPIELAAPPPDLLARWERQHLVRLALRRLGGPDQDLLIALYTNHGTGRYDEVARKLGIPEGSIGPTRARSLHKLRRLLEAMEYLSTEPATRRSKEAASYQM